jgi:hypothetical protein
MPCALTVRPWGHDCGSERIAHRTSPAKAASPIHLRNDIGFLLLGSGYHLSAGGLCAIVGRPHNFSHLNSSSARLFDHVSRPTSSRECQYEVWLAFKDHALIADWTGSLAVKSPISFETRVPADVSGR